MFFQRDLWKGLLFVSLLGILVSCAGMPPIEQLTLAKVALTAAQEAGAPRSAPKEFHLADGYLSRAERALERGQYENARDWSERAMLAAQLARAKVQQDTGERQLAEAQRTHEQLRQELDRQRSRVEELKRQL